MIRYVLTGLLVAGCATPLHQQAKRYSSPVLCYGVYAGNVDQQTAARAELAARGFNCTDRDREIGRQEWAAIQAGRQVQSDQDLAAAAILLGNSRPPPPAAAPAKPLTCTTVPLGNGMSRTDCR